MSSSISDELAKRAGKSADRDADTSEGERIRLEELHSYAILDTPPEARFDELARLAALVCKTPIAAISLLDEHRQWFKATVGLPMEADIPVAFCKHAIAQSGVYQIENTETQIGRAHV